MICLFVVLFCFLDCIMCLFIDFSCDIHGCGGRLLIKQCELWWKAESPKLVGRNKKWAKVNY